MATRPCAIDGCDRPAGVPGSARGWCVTHYNRWQDHGDVNWQPKRGRPICSIEGCESTIIGRGWCSMHYTRWRRYGDPEYRLPGEVIDGKKVCPTCEVDKPLDDYSPGSTGRCKTCAAEDMRERRKAGLSKTPEAPRWEATCEHCGASFMANRRRWRCCSPECSEARKHIVGWKYVIKRRARLKGALVEEFDRVEIFERDRWKCQICKEPVDRGVRAPDPRSVSLDHIMPISRGGKHERANVRTTHFGCNSSKGAFVEVLF